MDKTPLQGNKTSLILKLARGLSISVSLFSLLLMGGACLLAYHNSKELWENNVHDLSTYLAESLSHPVFVINTNTIAASSDAVMQNENIIGIRVFDQWDKELYFSKKEVLNNSSKIVLSITHKNVSIGRLEVFYLIDVFGFIHPNFIIGLFLVCLVIAGFSALFISIYLKRFLRGPINELSDVAIAFGNGDFKEKKNTKTVEFQVFEDVLLEMGRRIQIQIQELSKTNEDLLHEIRQKKMAESVIRKELHVNESIAEISKALLSEDYDIQIVSEQTLSAAKIITESRHGFVSSIDKNTLENVGLTLTEMFDKACDLKEQNVTFPIGDDGTYGGLWGHALNTRKAFYTNDPDSQPSSKGVPEGHIPLKNYMAVPVVIGHRLLGLIALASSDRAYSADDVDSVKRISELFALALQRNDYETEKTKMEERIRQSQKMEAIGNLAGGIAHDFNNILTPILGYAEMLAADFSDGSVEKEEALEILTAGKRGGELVKQILSFSRQNEHKLTSVQIQSVLKEVLKLSRATIPSDIKIHQDIQLDCGPVKADATQIHQVVMNLLTNAYHAVMEKSGEITVRFKKEKLVGTDLQGDLLKEGAYAVLTVSDNGIGMSKAIQNKIFDPYFTTKEKGKGTGLGLAVVYGIIKEYQGDISVYSEPGEGSVFKVLLPLIQKSVESASPNQQAELATGNERILLVDDETAITRLGKKILERLGYTVSISSDSMEALEMFKSNPDSFDLVISDMTMPNMTGDKLTKELLSIRPDIPIIICTGFSERINRERAEIIGVKGFLMKPVMASEMARIVRKVLDEKKYL